MGDNKNVTVRLAYCDLVIQRARRKIYYCYKAFPLLHTPHTLHGIDCRLRLHCVTVIFAFDCFILKTSEGCIVSSSFYMQEAHYKMSCLHLYCIVLFYLVSRPGLLPAVAPATQDIPRLDGAATTRSSRQRAASFGAVHVRRPALSRRTSTWSQSTPSTQLKGNHSSSPLYKRCFLSVCPSVCVFHGCR